MKKLPDSMTIGEARRHGRLGDTELVHLNPIEVSALQSLAPLTTNPKTGEKEAFLPLIASLFAPTLFSSLGLSLSPMLASAIGAGLGTWAETGDLKKGLLSGITGYGLGSVLGKVGGAFGGGGAASAGAGAGGGALSHNLLSTPVSTGQAAAGSAAHTASKGLMGNILGPHSNLGSIGPGSIQGSITAGSIPGFTAAANLPNPMAGLSNALPTGIPAAAAQPLSQMTRYAIGAPGAYLSATHMPKVKNEKGEEVAIPVYENASREMIAPPADYRPGFSPEHMYFAPQDTIGQQIGWQTYRDGKPHITPMGEGVPETGRSSGQRMSLLDMLRRKDEDRRGFAEGGSVWDRIRDGTGEIYHGTADALDPYGIILPRSRGEAAAQLVNAGLGAVRARRRAEQAVGEAGVRAAQAVGAPVGRAVGQAINGAAGIVNDYVTPAITQSAGAIGDRALTAYYNNMALDDEIKWATMMDEFTPQTREQFEAAAAAGNRQDSRLLRAHEEMMAPQIEAMREAANRSEFDFAFDRAWLPVEDQNAGGLHRVSTDEKDYITFLGIDQGANPGVDVTRLTMDDVRRILYEGVKAGDELDAQVVKAPIAPRWRASGAHELPRWMAPVHFSTYGNSEGRARVAMESARAAMGDRDWGEIRSKEDRQEILDAYYRGAREYEGTRGEYSKSIANRDAYLTSQPNAPGGARFHEEHGIFGGRPSDRSRMHLYYENLNKNRAELDRLARLQRRRDQDATVAERRERRALPNRNNYSTGGMVLGQPPAQAPIFNPQNFSNLFQRPTLGFRPETPQNFATAPTVAPQPAGPAEQVPNTPPTPMFNFGQDKSIMGTFRDWNQQNPGGQFKDFMMQRNDWMKVNRPETARGNLPPNAPWILRKVHEDRQRMMQQGGFPWSRMMRQNQNYHFAEGGYVNGPGDGSSDDVMAMIAPSGTPAALSDGEYVVPADVVAHLGNGSNKAGAKKLNGLVKEVRKKKTGRTGMPRRI
jgi:hypothetical protein